MSWREARRGAGMGCQSVQELVARSMLAVAAYPKSNTITRLSLDPRPFPECERVAVLQQSLLLFWPRSHHAVMLMFLLPGVIHGPF